jgi:hypothetical protein
MCHYIEFPIHLWPDRFGNTHSRNKPINIVAARQSAMMLGKTNGLATDCLARPLGQVSGTPIPETSQLAWLDK